MYGKSGIATKPIQQKFFKSEDSSTGSNISVSMRLYGFKMAAFTMKTLDISLQNLEKQYSHCRYCKSEYASTNQTHL